MKSELLEAGQVVNTHGVKGEVKVLPWSDSPEFLTGFHRVRVGETDYHVERCRVQGTCVLLQLEGVNDVTAAMKLREKIVSIYRSDASLAEGAAFIADLIGLRVLTQGEELGTVSDVIQLPSNDVYVVEGAHSYMIPAVKEFILEINVAEGFVRVKLLEGMRTDE